MTEINIQVGKNAEGALWWAIWDSYVGTGENPEGAVRSLMCFPEVQEKLKEIECESVPR